MVRAVSSYWRSAARWFMPERCTSRKVAQSNTGCVSWRPSAYAAVSDAAPVAITWPVTGSLTKPASEERPMMLRPNEEVRSSRGSAPARLAVRSARALSASALAIARLGVVARRERERVVERERGLGGRGQGERERDGGDGAGQGQGYGPPPGPPSSATGTTFSRATHAA